MRGFIALEDGMVLEGEAFGAPGKRSGEAVFNTSMTGYQEILTDPSYKGQIVNMTYPLIGNYGTNPGDEQSIGAQVEGFVVREFCPYPSNFTSAESLQDYLVRQGIVAITDVDTRALTKRIRTAGAMRAVIAAGDFDPDELVAEAKASPGLVGRDLAREVTCKATYAFAPDEETPPDAPHVVTCDYGAKRSIMRCLKDAGFRVTVVPAQTTAQEILALEPDGVMLSNGPGDPEPLTYAVETVRGLIGKKPIFGICLGHELLGLALGGSIFKLKFGHRGANQPVRDEETGRIDITCQNHGFGVDMDSVPTDVLKITHVNLNDGTVEGFRHRELPIMSVQYHPEASAGPHDARHLFGRFKDMVEAQMAQGSAV